MALEFKGVSRQVEGRMHIHPTDLTLEKGTMNVLLGPTLLRFNFQVQHLGPIEHKMLRWTDEASTSYQRLLALTLGIPRRVDL